MLLRIDGQDHYDTAHLAEKYTTVNSTACTWTVAAEGPGGKNCVVRTATSGAGSAGYLGIAPLLTQEAIWVPTASGVFGMKVKINDFSLVPQPLGAGNANRCLFAVLTGGQIHFAVQLNPDGTFTVVRAGFSGTTLATSTEALRENEWASVEVKWTISHTVGSVQIVVNRVVVLTVSGVDTQNYTELPSWDSVRLLATDAVNVGLITRMCDYYLADQSVGAGAYRVNDFLLSWEIAVIKPNGAGSVSDWTPSAGANYECVDEVPPNDDTDYISATTVTTRDDYDFEALPAGAIVKGFQIVTLPRLTAAGSAGLTPVYRTGGGTDAVGIEQGITQTGYDTFRMWPYDRNPVTDNQATKAEIDAAKFGLIKSA